MKKTLKIILILVAAGLYTANLYAQAAVTDIPAQATVSDIAAQAAIVAAGNDAGSAAGGAFGPPDDEEGEDSGTAPDTLIVK